MSEARPSAPPPPPTDTDSTRVRIRRDGSLPPSRRELDEQGEQADRMTRKLATARVLLASLPVSHPQSSLLRIAILRRDDTLLEGLFTSLREHPSQFPMQRTTLAPPSAGKE